MRNPAPIYIGTSGWHYDHWKGCFYPIEIPPSEWLRYYSTHFHSAEINASFYRLPDEHTLSFWRDSTPNEFVFSIKANRFITHMKKLKDPQSTLPPFMERLSLLGAKLGPILFQLPPRWHLNLDRLQSFMQIVGTTYRCAFEFRDPSWFDPRVYSILTEHHAAFCIYDLNHQLSPMEITTDFVYIRLHGPGGPYQGNYDEHSLSVWAERIAAWQAQGKQVYCYFDNVQNGYAPQNALMLQRMLNPSSSSLTIPAR